MPSISLCMIVKDEEKNLARCLNSVKTLVDEIIIVDTGSTDKTKSIALKFTDKVYDFTWVDDFSKARNYAFIKATKDFTMWLDADDVVTKDDLIKLKAIKEQLTPDVDVAMLKYNVGFNGDGETTFSYYRERIVRTNKGFFWNEPVHEYVQIAGNIKEYDAAITHAKIHDDHTPSTRNLDIYKKQLKDGGDLSTRGKYYFARELKTHAKYNDAIKWYKRFLKSDDAWIEDRISATSDLADCLICVNKHGNAVSLLLDAIETLPARANILIRLADLFDYQGAPDKAIAMLTAATTISPPSGWGFYQKDEYGYLPHIKLCVLYHKCGNVEKSYEHHLKAKEFSPNDSQVKYNDEYFASLKSGKA